MSIYCICGSYTALVTNIVTNKYELSYEHDLPAGSVCVVPGGRFIQMFVLL